MEVGATAPTRNQQWLMLTPHTKEFNLIFDHNNAIMCRIYDHYIGFILLALESFQVCVRLGLTSVKQL